MVLFTTDDGLVSLVIAEQDHSEEAKDVQIVISAYMAACGPWTCATLAAWRLIPKGCEDVVSPCVRDIHANRCSMMRWPINLMSKACDSPQWLLLMGHRKMVPRAWPGAPHRLSQRTKFARGLRRSVGLAAVCKGLTPLDRTHAA
jgi:hypothetical protein